MRTSLGARPFRPFPVAATGLLFAVTSPAARSQAADGPVVGWDLYGQPISIPGTVDGTSGTAIAVAADCAIQAGTHAVVCWGSSTGTPPDSVNGVAGTASAIAVAGAWACAIRAEDSAVVCWGDSLLHGAAPDSVNGIAGGASAISVGSNDSCAIQAATHAVVCWSAGSASLPVPDAVNGVAGTARAIAVGSTGSLITKVPYRCAIQAETGAVICW